MSTGTTGVLPPAGAPASGASGDPQDRFRAVHVAGTAGKGSVRTSVAGLLRAHGFRAGTHLSPHVHSLRERLRVDGAPVVGGGSSPLLAAVRPGSRTR